MEPVFIEVKNEPVSTEDEDSVSANDFLQIDIGDSSCSRNEDVAIPFEIKNTSIISETCAIQVEQHVVSHFIYNNTFTDGESLQENLCNDPLECSPKNNCSIKDSDLEKATLTADEEDESKCKMFVKNVENKFNLEEHLKTHKNEESHEQSQESCDKSFSRSADSKTSLPDHSKVDAELDDSLVCVICGKCFKHMNNLRRHLKIHNQHKPHKCNACSKSFIRLWDLKRHQLGHTGEKPFSCHKCNLNFRLIETLHRHMLTHDRDRLSPNTKMNTNNGDCNSDKIQNVTGSSGAMEVQDSNKSLVLDNVARMDEDIPNRSMCVDILTPKTLKEDEFFKCDVCSKTFVSKDNLRKHMKIHAGERPYKCSVCDRSFVRSTDLRRHIITHSTVKPFLCTFCNASYRQVDTLRRHLWTHTV